MILEEIERGEVIDYFLEERVFEKTIELDEEGVSCLTSKGFEVMRELTRMYQDKKERVAKIAQS